MFALLFGSFFGIAMMGFINASQPYLFTEVLNVPTAEQGPLGRLARAVEPAQGHDETAPAHVTALRSLACVLPEASAVREGSR